MKMEPRAKPVKISISSGGMEHYNLATLAQHYDYNVLHEFVQDGRLLKWLEQQGEFEIRNAVQTLVSGKLKKNANNAMAIAQVLFSKLDPRLATFCTPTELMMYWSRNGLLPNMTSFFPLLSDQDIRKLAKYLKEPGFEIALSSLSNYVNGNRKKLLNLFDARAAFFDKIPGVDDSWNMDDIHSFLKLRGTVLYNKLEDAFKDSIIDLNIKPYLYTSKVMESALFAILISDLLKYGDNRSAMANFLFRRDYPDNECVKNEFNTEWPHSIKKYISFVAVAINHFLGMNSENSVASRFSDYKPKTRFVKEIVRSRPVSSYNFSQEALAVLNINTKRIEENLWCALRYAIVSYFENKPI